MNRNASTQTLLDEISRLENLLAATRSQPPSLTTASTTAQKPPHPIDQHQSNNEPSLHSLPSHFLLLLSDSALPLGSFAFSSGLESYLAHAPSPSFPPFLALSLLSLATTTLPYLLAAHRTPSLLHALDSELDASTLCPVARRASVAQGRALLTVWERAFRATGSGELEAVLEGFAAKVKSRGNIGLGEDLEAANGHLGPVWGVVTRTMAIGEREAAYVFLLNHAKAVVSAAVRASVMGPYQAQGVLASGWLRTEIDKVMDQSWDVKVEEAAQGVPLVDLWVGRHELLYSRIFNS